MQLFINNFQSFQNYNIIKEVETLYKESLY